MFRTLVLIAPLLLTIRGELEKIDCVATEEEIWEDEDLKFSKSGVTCNKECGCGIVKKRYKIIQKAANGGVPCEYEDGEVVAWPCKLRTCEVIESEWSACSVTCGTGVKTRKATYKDGTPISDESRLTKECMKAPCCEFTEWIPGKCSAPCGNGNRTYTREQTADGAVDCGPLEKQESCQEAACPLNYTAILDTTCHGSPLLLTLSENGAEPKECHKLDTAQCIDECYKNENCRGFDETEGVCCFLSAVNETYTPKGATTCYKIRREMEGVESSDFYSWLTGLGTLFAVLFGAIALLGSRDGTHGKQQPDVQPSPRRPMREADHPSGTPINIR